jgi:peroxiredoxin
MKTLLRRTIAGTMLAGIAFLGVASTGALAGPEDKESRQAATAKVGEPAPAFTLKDADGKEHKLEDLKGKVVVLEWFNAGCPVVQMHYEAKTMQNLARELKAKDVVWLAVNTGAGSDNAAAKKDWSIDYPILLDADGKTGKAYGAKTTPHMFVIDKNGVLVYAGAIDDGSPSKVGSTNHVKAAVEQTLKGETVTNAQTKPYGCSVKYPRS